MTKKLISVLLCVALVLSVTPIVYAQEISNNIVPTVTYENGNQIVEEPYIIGELTEKRTENTKHFLMSDRSVLAAVYDRSVHYKDGNAWVDIDNSISAADENEFENKSNVFKTKFSKKSNGNKLVTITKDEFSLSWMLDGAQKVNAVISQSNTTESDDISALKNLEGVVTYPNIQNDVDLQYVVSGEDIKENIILQSANAPMEYVFTYKFNKLEYRTNDNNQIEFYDDSDPQKVVFVIDAPYMYDSDKAYSSDIEMQITETNNGFALTLIPNKEWLLSEDRVYPVVIDPTTLSKQEAKEIWDIEIRSTQTEAFNYKAGDFLVGTNTSGAIYRALLRFMDLPDIGVGGIVVNAQIHLCAYLAPGKDGDPAVRTRPTDDIQVNIHRIKALWPEIGATWNGYAGNYDSVIEDYFIYNDTDTSFNADITRLVNDWYKGTHPNYGIMLKANSEAAANHVMQFASSDYGVNETASATWRPILTVNYRTCIGLEDYWSYTTQSMGGYGTGYVNNYNGALTYVHDDVGFNSLINGFTLSHVYNSASTIKKVEDEDGNITTVAADCGRYGVGWGLNLVQTIEPFTIENNDYVKYVYTDGDGTKHYFVQEDDQSSIVDEDGLGFTLEKIDETTDSGTTPIKYKITTKDNIVLKFDTWGALRRIIDTNGNTINLNYSPVANQFNYLSSITTSSGGTIRLNYDSEYKLISIVDNANRVTTYSYTNGNLTRITYPDGTYLRLGYSGNNLCEIILPDNKKLCYFYYPNLKISAQNIKSAANNMTAQYCFNYNNNETEVIDLADRKLTYQFDSFGRVACAYDSFGNSYSQSYTAMSTTEDSIFANNKLSIASNNIKYINNLITNPVFADGLSSWTQYKEAPNQTQITVVSDETHISSQSIKITSTASSTQALLQAPNTTAGKTYTLSANIKAENVVSATHGATVEIVKSTPEGNRSFFCDFVTGTTDAEINNGFVTVRSTIELASNENIARIGVGLYKASGTVWVDSIQLEEGDTANKINLLSNSSFETNAGNNTVPSSYSMNFTSSSSGADNTDAQSGSYSLKIVGASNGVYHYRQDVNIAGNAGDVYSFGAWTRAYSIADRNNSHPYKMVCEFTNADGSTNRETIAFNTFVNTWQYGTKNIVSQKEYTKITVFLCYNRNSNYALYDDVFLYRDTAQSYKYDNNGNVVSTADYAKQQSSFSYNNDDTLAKMLNPDGSGYEYNYYNHLVQAAKSDQGVESKVLRDSNGNATQTYTTNALYTTSLTPGKTYRIRNKNSGMYITNDTQVARQYAMDSNDNKYWMLETAENGYYRLKYVPSGRYLTLSTTMSDDEYNVEIAPSAEKDTDAYDRQLFKFKVNSEGTYLIICKETEESCALRPIDASTSNAARITNTTAPNTYDDFCWYFEDISIPYTQSVVSGTTYRIRALHSGKYLDVQNDAIKQYTYVQQRQQRFVITDCSDYYTITLADAPNKYLAVDTSQKVVVKDSFDDSCKFAISTNGIMGTAIISPLSMPGYSLGIDGASLGYSASLVVSTDTAARSQRFVLEKASDIITSSATYQNNGNYPHTVTDSRGNTTTYTYDTAYGLQTGVTDALGNVTEYEYNTLNDRLESVGSGSSIVDYYYNSIGQLTEINSPSGTAYTFVYDEFGNTQKVCIEQQALVENDYDTSRGLLTKSTYGNGHTIGFTYDMFDRVTAKSYNDIVKARFRYDKFGNLYETQDLFTNVTFRYNYDLIGRISGINGTNGTSLNYVYDNLNRVSKYVAKIGNNTNTTEYIYGNSAVNGQKNGLIYGVKQNDVQRISYAYDELSRLSTRTLNTTTPFVTQYSYHQGATAGSTTTLIKTVQNGNDVYEYAYDAVGNITQIKKNGTVYESYTYDDLGQLTLISRGGIDFYDHYYDDNGNLLSVGNNGVTIKSYTYGDSDWRDLLTEFNGQTITYDQIGNPLQYRDGFNFTWSNGRQLTSITKGTDAISYVYNADGLRVQKTVNGTTTDYYWLEGVLLGQKTGNDYIIYLYDENGTAYGIICNNTYYYYVFNAQGDVVGIIDQNGTRVVSYDYSAWGEVLSVTGTMADTLGQANPIRYRGYYYDNETGFYYLQSRYYDPVTQRFLNADGYVSTGQGILGNNMFAYCANNPVNLADDNGQAPFKVARYLLSYWILGGGKDLILKNNSLVSRALKKSKTMQKEINEEIEKYKKGQKYGTGTVIFKKNEPDLWLGIRRANYVLTIDKETKTTGFWFFKKRKTRYVVNVKVSDTYDFNVGDESGDGIGSLLNNFGYLMQEQNVGKAYYWEANYVYKTKWK